MGEDAGFLTAGAKGYCPIFFISVQRDSPAGELNADLMVAAGEKADLYETVYFFTILLALRLCCNAVFQFCSPAPFR